MCPNYSWGVSRLNAPLIAHLSESKLQLEVSKLNAPLNCGTVFQCPNYSLVVAKLNERQTSIISKLQLGVSKQNTPLIALLSVSKLQLEVSKLQRGGIQTKFSPDYALVSVQTTDESSKTAARSIQTQSSPDCALVSVQTTAGGYPNSLVFIYERGREREGLQRGLSFFHWLAAFLPTRGSDPDSK